MDSLVAANSKFCFDLFKEISKDGSLRNIFLCPLSLSAALGMVHLGARSDSACQINKVLHFNEVSQNEKKEPGPRWKSNKSGVVADSPVKGQGRKEGPPDLQAGEMNSSNDALNCCFGKLLSKLYRTRADYTLSIANRLYGEQGFLICPEYLDGVVQFYHTTMESLDFRKDIEKSRQEINFWVESQSQGRIKEFFSKDTINNTTVLVLVNAVYFKAKWENVFDYKNTVDASFTLNENEKKSVKMMNQTGLFRIGFIEDLQAQILEMRYTKGKISMFVLLPRSSSDNLKGLEELESKMTYEKMVECTNPETISEETVAVSFPQFTLEDSYDLNAILQAMGIVDIFDEAKTDLTGISSSPSLYLSKFVHKTCLEVDEDGTQAVAASGAVGVTRTSYVTFNADHPFLFFIRHNKTQTLLFYGRVCSP
ncbi:PREDICTED: serpin B12 [Chrysochloris asiatica]|uniref:Serpin B12 n=1 Tax=Chrysochloris asiatica TaxID=185453 RepID=A0A9B0TC81_CHRAS|nr:PREDICTED: serpin B12 [Chrysochloris asiatica]